MSNSYHSVLTTSELPLTAESLLCLLRPEAEEKLQELGLINPPSQSYRAIQALRGIDAQEAMIRDAVKDVKEIMRLMRPLRRLRDFFKDFLAVHRTCYILEGRAL